MTTQDHDEEACEREIEKLRLSMKEVAEKSAQNLKKLNELADRHRSFVKGRFNGF